MIRFVMVLHVLSDLKQMTSSIMLSYVGYILSIWFAYRCLSFDQLFYMILWSSWFKSDLDPQITRKRQSWDEILFCKFNLIVQKAIVHDFQWSLKASSLFKSHFKKWIWLIIDFDYQPISWMTQHIVKELMSESMYDLRMVYLLKISIWKYLDVPSETWKFEFENDWKTLSSFT